MPWSFGWRTLKVAVSFEGEGISVGAGRISPHLRVDHINTDWDKRSCVKRSYRRLFTNPSFKRGKLHCSSSATNTIFVSDQ